MLLPSKKYFKINKRLCKLNIKNDDILIRIRNLNVNKARGHDDISLALLKIHDSVLTEPLSKNCIDRGVCTNTWKICLILFQSIKRKTNALLIITAQFLFAFCGKIFERTIFSDVFLFLESNNLITPKQSGFSPNDSCVNQLLSIVHSIYSDFDHNSIIEARGIFLDVSKAFDKVCHGGLLYKLETLDILGNLLKLFQGYLSEEMFLMANIPNEHQY